MEFFLGLSRPKQQGQQIVNTNRNIKCTSKTTIWTPYYSWNYKNRINARTQATKKIKTKESKTTNTTQTSRKQNAPNPYDSML